MKILFLGEAFHAISIPWISGIEFYSKTKINILHISIRKNRFLRILSTIPFFIKCLKTYFDEPFDICLAYRATSYGFFSLFVNSRLKVVAQQGISDVYPPTLLSILFKSFLKKMTYKNVDLIHAWGHVMVPVMLKYSAHPSKIIVKPKGINLNLYTFNAKKNYDFSIIVTRSIEEDYRHVDIIEAAKLLRDTYSQSIKITIVGGGSLLNKLEQKVKDYSLTKNIEFKGRISNDHLPQLLRSHSIYLSVPVTEGVSSSLMEAMASGCIPIVTDLPGNRVFITPGYNGELVKVKSPCDIADKIYKVLTNPVKYEKGVLDNRKWIEQHANFHINMKYFYDLYSKKLLQKCAEL
ncbi:glycosyltransferase family 4 protein [Thermaurantimonas aggregans]|uniref:glycosyltransferase family 4 protein n=1 Tax=Thermaurantimonas aggregans TaxID=2173829 RepID=UPI0023F44B42|nr:glycosyltransferase family 4 protein [Thermaurantimonas aggregans]MCX8148592.1 glycosyltransferase family 4 protein [Thermaurantimonas aggregans]